MTEFAAAHGWAHDIYCLSGCFLKSTSDLRMDAADSDGDSLGILYQSKQGREGAFLQHLDKLCLHSARPLVGNHVCQSNLSDT